MKRVLPILLILICTCAFGADKYDNGIYLREQIESAPMIESQDGQKLYLGAKQELKIQKCELFSQDNANTLFYLSLTVPYDANIGPSTYILIVDGTAYQQRGSGFLREETSSLSFNITGKEKAEQISNYFNEPIFYRKHPRHNLLVSFTPTQQEFDVSSDVTVTLRIKNVGSNSVAFKKGGRNRAARDNQYVFTAYRGCKQVEDIGTSDHMGGLSFKYLLKPGEVFEDKISLSKWFSFSEPGMYVVHGSYYLCFQDPEDDSWRTLWEDYVSADFIVTIKQPDETLNKKEETSR